MTPADAVKCFLFCLWSIAMIAAGAIVGAHHERKEWHKLLIHKELATYDHSGKIELTGVLRHDPGPPPMPKRYSKLSPTNPSE